MDMGLLKHLDNRVQIINLIEKATLFGGDIWQTHTPKEGRQLSQIIQIQLDAKQDKIILRTPSVVEMNPKEPIFVRLAYRNLIFRMVPGEFKVNGDKISCNYPREGRALEERKNERYVLPFASDISISLKRIERTYKDTTYDMELRVIDVSERGFGILISGQNRDYFKKGDHFKNLAEREGEFLSASGR